MSGFIRFSFILVHALSFVTVMTPGFVFAEGSSLTPYFLERGIDLREKIYGEDFRADDVLGENLRESVEGALVLRRSNDIGTSYEVDIEFKDAIDISPNKELKSFIGIDQHDRLVNVIKYEGRSYARILSNKKKIRDFFVLSSGDVIAIDISGKTYLLSQEQWLKGVDNWARLRKSATSSLITLVSVGLLTLVESQYFTEIPLIKLSILNAIIAIPSTSMLTAWIASLDYESSNSNNQGLISLKTSVPPYSWSVPIRDELGDIVDYSLVSPVDSKKIMKPGNLQERVKLSDKVSFTSAAGAAGTMLSAVSCREVVLGKHSPAASITKIK